MKIVGNIALGFLVTAAIISLIADTVILVGNIKDTISERSVCKVQRYYKR